MANTPYPLRAEVDAALANIRTQYNYGAVEYRGFLTKTQTPTLDGWYWATEIGTYTNAGNLVTVANKINMIEKSGITYKLYAIDVPTNNSEPWTNVAGYPVNTDRTHLGKLWKSNAATATTDVPGISSKWDEVLFGYGNEIKGKASLFVGKNKFNVNTASSGFYIDSNTQVSNASYVTSDFISVIALSQYISNLSIRFTNYYDSGKNWVAGGSSVALTTFTPPIGVAFVKISINTTISNPTLLQLEIGSVSTSFSQYEKVISDSEIPLTIQRKTDPVTLTDGSVTEPKTIFFDASKNLFNPNDVDVKLGFYVSSSEGITFANASYNASGYIPVVAGQNYTMSFKHQIAWYNSSKVYISGSSNTDSNKTQLVPAGAAFVRCSILASVYSTFQFELGSVQTSYEPFGYTFKKNYIDKNLLRYENILGNNCKLVSQSTLASNAIIEVTDFPFHLKKGLSMSIYADVTTIGSVSYGKGYGKYRGEYFTIDGTNVSQYNDGVLVIAKPHGLTLSTFVKSSFSVDDNGVANLILQSLNGYYATTFQMNYEMNYEAFIRAGGQAITNVKLTVGSKDFQHSVWAFGDSYFGIGANRWVGTMKTFGYFNFLINGLAGQSSPGAYSDLLKCLNYGTPKYIIWCLGMNDADASYIDTLNLLKSLCDSKNIKLILSTVPTVPSRNKEVIKTTVLSSGNRYIDFYKAMGANSSGVWYGGYLNADGVHPNQLGADALATQVLVDFPELMQYGKNL